ncbi:DUF2750 domain-containing protein [Nannocystis radixulma]|uniref:DUF2750 domain-containing protein n=1 Tax=Nannocystis radixulma TaxID=2995305 RepID=A0ABT5BPJ8_9BACT|nr:DUF2750 domain-containing protein [Nannocystis radixulma]MDC0676089.1 DUF2750 domain-containing protein [Nannocystis radixulma]
MLQLDGKGRFSHFVKRVVDEEQAWGLWQDGWALMADSQGVTNFPLWPAEEYAKLCATKGWSEFEPKALTLESLLDELAFELKGEGVRVAVFPVPSDTAGPDQGVSVSLDELWAALRAEMEKYEL